MKDEHMLQESLLGTSGRIINSCIFAEDRRRLKRKRSSALCLLLLAKICISIDQEVGVKPLAGSWSRWSPFLSSSSVLKLHKHQGSHGGASRNN